MGALRDSRFRRLVVGQSLSNFGDTALYLSLGIWAKDLTGSNAAAGLVFLALGLPIIAAPIFGHLVDRVRRRRLLIVANLIGGLSVLPLLAVESQAQLWVIYAVAAVYGAIALIVSAAQSALLKDMLADADLASANATLGALGQGLRILSPLVGAALYASFGGASLVMLDALTFAAAVLMLLTIRVTESRPDPDAREPLRREVVAGLRHIVTTPVLAQISAAMALAFGVLGFLETVDFAIIDEGLHRPPAFFGVLTSVQGAGSVLGGVTASLVVRRLGETRTVGFALLLDALGALALTQPSMLLVLTGSTVMGVGVSWFIVGSTTAMQRFTPARLQGRVAATATMVTWLPQTASIALGAGLIGLVDYRVLLAIVTAVVASAGFWVLLRPSPAPASHLTSDPATEAAG